MLTRSLFRSVKPRSALLRPAFYSTTPSTTPSQSKVELAEEMPGFRAPGEIATNYELATGKERYEHLKNLKGEEAWEDSKPIILTAKGTKASPIQLKGYDPVYYVGCSGMSLSSCEWSDLVYLAYESL